MNCRQINHAKVMKFVPGLVPDFNNDMIELELIQKNEKRRDFIKKTALGAAAISFGGILPGISSNLLI